MSISTHIRAVPTTCLLALAAVTLRAQAPPPTPATPAAPGAAAARPARPDATMIAGIPVNYDESKVGTYTLADPLKLDDGKQVKDAKTWNEKRRPEILKIFATQQYGVMPPKPTDESFEVTDKGTPALNGKAIRKQITIHLSKDPSWPMIHVLEYIPAKATKP